MFVVPKPGFLVPDPTLGDTLPAAGREVASNDYWIRRLADGDVTSTTAPATSVPVTGLQLPKGPTAGRNPNPEPGEMRYNTTLGTEEYWSPGAANGAGAWLPFGTGGTVDSTARQDLSTLAGKALTTDVYKDLTVAALKTLLGIPDNLASRLAALEGGTSALPAITVSPASPTFVAGAAPGSLVATLGAVPSGATRTYGSDGRLALNNAQTGVVVGLTAHTGGTTASITVTDTPTGGGAAVTKTITVSITASTTNALPFRVALGNVTVTGSSADSAAATAIAGSAAAKSNYGVQIPAGTTAKLTMDIAAVGSHGAEFYCTNEVNMGGSLGSGAGSNWTITGRRSFDGGTTWATLPGLPTGTAWAPWAPSGAPTTINERAQAFHIPQGAASRIEISLVNGSANLQLLTFRGVRDMNSDARLVIGVAGNSNAVSAENHANWITDINALKAGADPMVLDLHRGSAKVDAIRMEQIEPFLARFPRFTHLVHAENNNSADTGPFLPANAPVINSTMQQHLDWYDGLYDLYEQHPGKVFVGPMEAVLDRTIAATDLMRAITGEPSRTAGKFSEWNLRQRCPDILARSALRATSWDEDLGCMKGGWDLFRLDEWETTLDSAGLHSSGSTANAKVRKGSRFAFAAITGTVYKAPIVQILEDAEAASGGITAARRARIGVLLDYLDAFTPAPTSAQASARSALRTRLAAIGTGTGGGTGTGITGSIADVSGNSATAGQAITLAVSRSPAGASYVVLVNHDVEVQRVQLASGAASVTLTPTTATASGRSYIATLYDAATDEVIDQTAPFVAVAGAAADPSVTTRPTITSTGSLTNPKVGDVLTASDADFGGNPKPGIQGRRWRRGDGTSQVGITDGTGTGATYTLVAGDIGYVIDHIQVSTDTSTTGTSNAVTAYSTNRTGLVAAASAGSSAPTNTAAPAISSDPAINGAPRQSYKLTASTGTWTGSPTAYAYEWQRDDTAISGAVAAIYTLTSADVGHVILCKVTATNAQGSASASTAATAVVQSAVAPTVVTPPALSSTGSLTAPKVGDVLTAADAVFGGDPPAKVSGRRFRRGPQGGSQTSIANASTATYTLVAEDVGSVIDHIQTSTNTGAGAVTGYSAKTGVVSA